MTEPVRLALTISGAVSLGAFEGGALAAILSFVQAGGHRRLGGGADDERPWPVTIDVMSGASAGSITALLAARVLTSGLDALDSMRDAWVRAPSLRTLTQGAARAPLTPEGLRRHATEILSAAASEPRQPAPVTVHMALTALAGLRYTIPDLAWGRPVQATTHLDWGEVTFAPGAPISDWTTPAGGSAVDIALASAASPLAFPPYPVNRRLRARDWETYQRNGVRGLPTDGWIWYTDGGTIENEPLGRTLDLAAAADRDGAAGRRVHVLIHPHPTGGSSSREWSGPDGPSAAWLRALARADRIQRTQTLFDDLRRAERTNSRLVWRRELERRLLGHRDALDGDGRRSFDEALGASLASIREDRDELQSQVGSPRLGPAGQHPSAASTDPRALLDAVLDEVTGTAGQPIAFAVISPVEIAEERSITVEELLAGEFLFHFGGFLDEGLRAHDFAVGYDAAARWLRSAVATGGPLSSVTGADEMLARVESRRPGWSLPVPPGSTGARWRTVALGARSALLALRDLLVWQPWRRRQRAED